MSKYNNITNEQIKVITLKETIEEYLEKSVKPILNVIITSLAKTKPENAVIININN